MQCKWEDDPDDHTKIRCANGCGIKLPINFKTKNIKSNCRVLSKTQKALNYTKHFLQHKICGSKEAKPSLVSIRKKICEGCRHRNQIDNSCLYCGCPIDEKSKWQEQNCPVSKWPKSAMESPQLYRAVNGVEVKINMQYLYEGGTCFFIGGGPSLKAIDMNFLQNRGIFSLAVNNIAARDVKPNFWMSADDPTSFHENIWRDPSITKFVTKANYYKKIRTKETISKLPATCYFDINEDFDPNTFLKEPTFNFGNHSVTTDELGNKGGRCVMLMALKLLYYLGFKYIYLLGCDFHMDEKQPYAFEQTKWSGGVASNNDKFRIINERLTLLAPKFKEAGITVKNCTKNSKLTAFEYKDLDTVIGNQTDKFDLNCDLSKMYGEKSH